MDDQLGPKHEAEKKKKFNNSHIYIQTLPFPKKPLLNTLARK